MSVDIQVRNMRFVLGDATPRYWYGDDPAKTHYMNSLSTAFPEGEAFFVRAVLHYRDHIESPELKKQVAAFAAQEGMHAREHSAHTELLVSQGYPWMAWLAKEADREGRWFNEKMPLMSLVSTAALEHLTAIFAHRALDDPDYWREPMHESMAPLWQWHAIEEAEHKSVAFDVYQQVSGSYLLRCIALIFAAGGLWFDNLVRFAYLSAKDGLLFSPGHWGRMLKFVWGPGGFFTANWRAFFQWFRPGFHPWQQDDSGLIEAGLADLAGYVSRPVSNPVSSPA